jgi:AraC-like DNA-binding protein
MSLHQFSLFQGISEQLDIFPQIDEFSLRKINAIELGSFEPKVSENFQVWFVINGKFEWQINNQNHILLPGSTAIILPGQEISGVKGFLDLGILFCLILRIDKMDLYDKKSIFRCNEPLDFENATIGKILKDNFTPTFIAKEIGCKLMELHDEISINNIGYDTRVNHLIDSILIIIVRKVYQGNSCSLEIHRSFQKLNQSLHDNLAHHWSVGEMAESVGMGTTSFTEKLKSYSGFTPMNYLIKMRISESVKLLKEGDSHITDIAIKTGFYSSQHFSTTFKKMTGHTPREFRSLNILRKKITDLDI